MTLAKNAAMVTAEARARVWWRLHRQRQQWWQQPRAVGHHPIVIFDGGGKDVIAAATIDHRCSQR